MTTADVRTQMLFGETGEPVQVHLHTTASPRTSLKSAFSIVLTALSLLGAGVIAISVISWQSSWSPSPKHLLILMLSCAMLALVISLIHRVVAQKREHHGLEDSYPNARVICHAHYAERERFDTLSRDQFEPIVFTRSFTFSGPRFSRFRSQYLDEMFTIGVMIPVLCACYKPYLGFLVGALLVAVIRGPVWARPLYLRVSPGRLEVLVGLWRSPSVKVLSTIHVDTCPVTLRLNEYCVYVYDRRQRSLPVAALGLGGFSDPYEVGVAVLRACLTPPGSAAPCQGQLCG